MLKGLLKEINSLLPFRGLIWFVTGIAVTVQSVVIIYIHLTGFYHLESFGHFLARLLFGSILSSFSGFILVVTDLYIIARLNAAYPWNRSVSMRVMLQLSLSLLLAVAIGVLITLISDMLGSYDEAIGGIIISNALITAVVNVMVMIVLEAWIFFNEGSRARREAEILERELSKIRFEVLKSQINPHFMFNSLNVLSGLIEKDTVKAQKFIDEFSMIYRYVLETIEKPVVTLGEELGFIRSWFFLQQIRYGESLSLDTNLPANLLDHLLPPLSLQIVLENAVKHNIVNASQPLRIELFSSDSILVVRNNLQPKMSSVASTRLGQVNLTRRYSLIGGKVPQFIIGTGFYTVKLPLLIGLNDEGTDN